MKTKSLHRKPASIAKGRWAAYATAGAASALTCVNSAQAVIHYSGLVNRQFHGWDLATFQLDQPGDSFTLAHKPHYYSTFSVRGGSANFGINALAGASFAGFYVCALNSQTPSVSDLSRGEPISAQRMVPGPDGILASAEGWNCAGGNRGQFFGPGNKFIGFRFNNGSGAQYGWVRLQTGGPNNSFRLIDYAYGDVGDRVKTGQKSGGHAPELESLGGLALGAAGLLAWRKRRSQPL